MLVNLVIDSGAIWNLDDGRSLIELQHGVQWINTSTLITGDKLTIVPHNQNLTTENTGEYTTFCVSCHDDILKATLCLNFIL